MRLCSLSRITTCQKRGVAVGVRSGVSLAACSSSAASDGMRSSALGEERVAAHLCSPCTHCALCCPSPRGTITQPPLSDKRPATHGALLWRGAALEKVVDDERHGLLGDAVEGDGAEDRFSEACGPMPVVCQVGRDRQGEKEILKFGRIVAALVAERVQVVTIEKRDVRVGGVTIVTTQRHPKRPQGCMHAGKLVEEEVVDVRLACRRYEEGCPGGD